MKIGFSRFLCLILAVLLVISTFPLSVSAAETECIYVNGSDYAVLEGAEISIDTDANDALVIRADDSTRTVFSAGVITLLSDGTDVWFLAYSEGCSVLYRYRMTASSAEAIYSFSGLVTSMALRGRTLYFAESEGVTAFDLSTGSRKVFLPAQDVTLVYFAASDRLTYYTGTGSEAAGYDYRFSTEKLVPKIKKREEACYSPRLTAPARDDPYYTTLNIFHLCGYGMTTNNGNCTCYAYGRSYENLGVEPRLSWGNAGEWYDDNLRTRNYACGDLPALGAVAVWKKYGGAGHVGVVEIIDGSTVITSESGWQSFYFRTKARDIEDPIFSASTSYSFDGFIYVMGTDLTTEPLLDQTPPAYLGEEKTVLLESDLTRQFLTATDRGVFAAENLGASGQIWVLQRTIGHNYTVRNCADGYLNWNEDDGVFLGDNNQEFYPYVIDGALYLSPVRSAGEAFLCMTPNGLSTAAYDPEDESLLFRLVDLSAVLDCFDSDHTFEKSVLEATCTADGCVRQTCTDCGKTYSYDTVPALGHDWDEGELLVSPTVLNDGTIKYACQRCGKTEEVTVARPVCKGGDDCPGCAFSDMPAVTNWAHAAIHYCLEQNYFSGASATVFDPKGSMTRAMLVAVLYRMEDAPEFTTAISFSDVPLGKWYTYPVYWAAECGIVSGVGNGKFDPTAAVTREQIAVIMYNYAKWKGLSTDGSASLSSFADEGRVSKWAREGVSWAVDAGLISGVPQNGKTVLQPRDTATRAQVASIIGRFDVSF